MPFRLPRPSRSGLALLFLAGIAAPGAAFAKPAAEPHHAVTQSSHAAKPAPESAAPDAAEPEGAPTIIGPNDRDAILKMAKGYGDAELTKVESGDPVIIGSINGTDYQLFFLGCTKHADCKILDFYAIWNQRDVALDTINDWNASQPFNKAYLSDDGLPVVELDLSTVGLTSAALADTFDRWTIALAQFPRAVLDAGQ
ncbi:YbjN domain-containing protein [Jiella sp. M17.18]|uniref:YbjN domain-containing protein n=1 Tax=Jiella sp. M17.18 TaxID=3234247 RepID=UPI0034E02BF6